MNQNNEPNIMQYLETKAKANYDGIPEIPQNLENKLYEVYCRYQNFIGLCEGEFPVEEMEKDRRKYSYLLLPSTEDETIVFEGENCVEYMHLHSEIPKDICAAFMYKEDIETVASGFVEGDTKESLQSFYETTISIIEKFNQDKIR